MAALFSRIQLQLHRPETEGGSIDDQDNNFWRSYRSIDNILLNTVMCFPGSMASASGLQNPGIALLNLEIHACTISLHQSAQFFAGKNPRLAEVSRNAKSRCIVAANEMVAVLRQISDQTLMKVQRDYP